jgi:hypothetical protein
VNTATETARQQRERELNDRLRSTLDVLFGNVVISPHLSSADRKTRQAVLTKVASWEFENDSGVHSEGHFEHGGDEYFWQIRCCQRCSRRNQPTNKPHSDKKTLRVLVIGMEWEFGQTFGPR